MTTSITLPSGKKYDQPTGLYINGKFESAIAEATFATIDPSTGKEIVHVSEAREQDVDKAVTAARVALKKPEWRDMNATDRGMLLIKLAQKILDNKDLLAEIESLDAGKKLGDAEGDIAESAKTLQYYGGWADKITGQTIDVGPAKHAFTIHEPIGVCGLIVPWNFPLMIATWKLGPALACGNTVVLKSAEQTPLSVLLVASWLKEIGFPDGVVNIISGLGKVAGKAISSHMNIDKVSFTGSTATGRDIMKSAAMSNLKNVTLECGGKSPNIVFEDADLEQAVKWSVQFGMYFYQGQVCTCTARHYIQKSIYPKFLEMFKKETKSVITQGPASDANTFLGPQISQTQVDRIMGFIDTAKKEGAKLELGGNRVENMPGYFIEPTIFTDVKPDMTIAKEEIFGPVCAISTFETEEEALELANNTTYGLAASVFTQNMARAHRMIRGLETGQVYVNEATANSTYLMPFGGSKQSGVGRELGAYALTHYSNVKAVHVNIGADL